MKLPLPLLALAALLAFTPGVWAQSTGGNFQVQNAHGGYNVNQSSAPPPSAALFQSSPSSGSSSNSTFQVANPHGGYSVNQSTKPPPSLGLFGPNGFAALVIFPHIHDKPKFILVPTVEDQGHGGKVTVYKRIYYATAEEAAAAEAARLKQ